MEINRPLGPFADEVARCGKLPPISLTQLQSTDDQVEGFLWGFLALIHRVPGGVFEMLKMTGHVRNLVGLEIELHMLDQVAIKAGRTIMPNDAVANAGPASRPRRKRGA